MRGEIDVTDAANYSTHQLCTCRFSKLVATPELRFIFIKSAMKFLRDHSFDGIDFDWVSSTQLTSA